MKKRKSRYAAMNAAEKALGWLYMAISLLALPTALHWFNGQLAAPMNAGTLNFVYYLINFFSMICIFRHFLWDSLADAWQNIWDWIQAVILGYVAYRVCGYVMDAVMSRLLPGFTNVNDASISAMAGESYTLMAVGVVLLVPPAEELLYRGLIFRSLWRRSKAAGYLVSMAAFAAIHVVGYIGSASPATLVICFLQYLPAGACLAWTYSKADNIFAPMAVHAIVNAVAIGALR